MFSSLCPNSKLLLSCCVWVIQCLHICYSSSLSRGLIPLDTDHCRGWSQVEREKEQQREQQPPKSWGRSKWKTLGTLVSSHKTEKHLRRLLTSRLRENIIISSFLETVCGSQCEIRVVWGLSSNSLASFHRFPFLPCQLTFPGLNICVFHSWRILPFYISVQPAFLKLYGSSLLVFSIC